MQQKNRKEYVKEQRKKFKSDPKKFIKKEIINPTIKYWKEEPLNAIGTFVFWILAFYIIFGTLQGILLDTVYCDSTIDQYDGKVMYVYNDFVNYYNEKAQEMQQAYTPNPYEQKKIVENFNQEYNMICEHDFKKWGKEWTNRPFLKNLEEIGYSIKKVLLKQ